VPSGERVTGVFVGLATLDVVHRVDAQPGPNQKVTARAQHVAAGGPAANAAVTFAGLGGHAILVTALGRDPLADLIRADLGAWGVTVVDVAPDQDVCPPVSAVAVTISTGDRSVVSTDGAATDVEPPPDLRDVVLRGGVVLIDGHHPRLAIAAAEAAAAAGIDVVVDAGRWKPVMAGLIPLAGAMVCSRDFRVPGLTDSDATARALVAAGVDTVITTHGGDPVLWWHGGGAGSVPVPPVVPVDTLGAGDVFHGAYCYFSRRAPAAGHAERDLPAVLSSAARVAALRCSIVGPRAWLTLLAADPTQESDTWTS